MWERKRILRCVALLCDSHGMGQQRQGRVQIEPGPWSLAVAARIAEIVDAREGKRDRFQQEAGFSGRLAKLLNGERAWYLEDVERACAALDIDVLEFLGSLGVPVPGNVVPLLPRVDSGQPHPALASVTRWPEDGEDVLDAAMDMDREPGTTIEED